MTWKQYILKQNLELPIYLNLRIYLSGFGPNKNWNPLIIMDRKSNHTFVSYTDSSLVFHVLVSWKEILLHLCVPFLFTSVFQLLRKNSDCIFASLDRDSWNWTLNVKNVVFCLSHLSSLFFKSWERNTSFPQARIH